MWEREERGFKTAASQLVRARGREVLLYYQHKGKDSDIYIRERTGEEEGSRMSENGGKMNTCAARYLKQENYYEPEGRYTYKQTHNTCKKFGDNDEKGTLMTRLKP